MRYHTMAANLPATRAARMPAGLLYTCTSTGPRVPPSMDTPSLPATAIRAVARRTNKNTRNRTTCALSSVARRHK